MSKPLTSKQQDIIHAFKANGLRKDEKGRYYYSVPSSKRRNCRMLVTEKEIGDLRRMNLI